MATMFLLDVETNAADRRARLRLLDENEVHLGAHEVALADHPAAMWSGLFDTRRHVARLRGVETPEAQLVALGRFLGEGVLGDAIAGKLAEGVAQPIALVQGLAGLGKTSLAAEAVHLWFDRFDYVLCFQAKGGALSIEEFYRVLDQRLALASRPYRERCQEDDMAKVYLPPGPSFKGAVREGKLRENLIDALGAERVLLVLDNFETNLHKSGGPEYASLDPAWDGLLEALGDRLGETGSRVLVTSRHKLASLADPRHATSSPPTRSRSTTSRPRLTTSSSKPAPG